MDFPNLPDGLDDWVYVTITLVVAVTVLLVKFWKVPDNIRSINEKLDHDKQRLDRNDADWSKYHAEHEKIESKIDAIQATQLRNELFKEPTDKEQHEHLLEVGEDYVRNGWNSSGKIRYEQLKETYAKRLKDNNWDYSQEI